MSMHQRAVCRGIFDQFQRMRGYAHHVAGFAGAMARAPGALQKARNAFRAADLQHLIHGREVHAQIQAGGGLTQRRLPSANPRSAAARSDGSSEP